MRGWKDYTMGWEKRPDLLAKRQREDRQKAEKRRIYLMEYMREYRRNNSMVINSQRRRNYSHKQIQDKDSE